ncbi:MAG: PqqD family protein [Candidatus Firestonebacteria bacterium]
MLKEKDKIGQHKNAIGRIIEGNAFIVLPEKNVLCKIDETGTFIWQQLNIPKTIEELKMAVCENFVVDEKTAYKDLTDFIELLLDKEILEIF